MSEFLKVKGLCKSYRSGSEKLDILADLSVEVGTGQIMAITGASGSGKSTLLHLIGGMEKSDAGSILVEGVEITGLAVHQLAHFRNRKVGFVFQFHHLLPEFTSLENVMFPLLLRHLPYREVAMKARDLLEEVGLKDRLNHKPGELSGGEQQRVAVARALIGRPGLLLGDEPTGNLDEYNSALISSLLMKVHRRHKLTSVIVTHNPKLAGLCDVQKCLSSGKLVANEKTLS